ncbi:MAG: dienelactone hydrolase family protein [Planctomycetaceae bacterium]|nr:dienelactone hydrolase family protein [Planctomycetaceae bacterium]
MALFQPRDSRAAALWRRCRLHGFLFAITVGLLNVATLVAGDVEWLADVVSGPAMVPDAVRGHFTPLLIDDNGETVRTREEWGHRREEIRRAWFKFLGPMPRDRPPAVYQVLQEDRAGGCVRQLVEYDAEAGQPAQAYLLIPLERPGGRLPAIVALHQTSDAHIEEIAGVKGPEAQHLGLKLAARGFVVFCPRNFLWQDVDNYQEAVARFQTRHPETRGMHKMLFDAMRAVDLVEGLPFVDDERIGCVGHSLGGKEALYLAAFDDRIRAAVASELGMGFTFTNWDAPWYLGPEIHQADFPRNHHELMALIAPRPFLLLAGESGGRGVADGNRSWPYLAAAHPICALYEAPVRIGMYNHGQGHSLPNDAFDRLAEWLDTYLTR